MGMKSDAPDRRPFRRAALAAFGFVTLGFGWPDDASAAELKLQGVGEGWIGYTDNFQSVPDVPLPGTTPKSGGAFALLSPGLVLALVSRRAVQRLKYTYTYDLFLGDTSLSTSSNQADYRAFFDLSPRVGLIAGASAIQSNQNSAVILSPPGAGAVNAVPTGSGSFLAASADELVSYDVAEGVRAYEGAAVTEQTPIFDTVAPRTFATGGRVGVERSWEADAVGLEPRADYTVVTGSVNPDGTPAGEQQQLVGAGVASWRHDWGRWFTSRAEGGALRVERLNTGHGFWEPTGTAALAYVAEFGDAEAVYRHSITTNPLLGQSLLVDELRLRGAVPLTKKGEVLVAVSSGYQRGRILDDNANLAAHVNAILADAGVGWQVTPSLLLGVRYQHIEQKSDTQVPPLPLSFVKNSILIGATVHFPPDREMPREYRAPRRVDRSDEIRDTVSPGGPPERQGGAGT